VLKCVGEGGVCVCGGGVCVSWGAAVYVCVGWKVHRGWCVGLRVCVSMFKVGMVPVFLVLYWCYLTRVNEWVLLLAGYLTFCVCHLCTGIVTIINFCGIIFKGKSN
jgi:hypothetical protein